MAQHDYNIANAGGAAVRSDINSALAAIQSINSGSTAPTSTVAGMLWYDTGTGTLKQRNSANTAWVAAAELIGGGSPFGGMRNRVINGGCQVRQKSVATITGSPLYGAVDQFLAYVSGGTGINGAIGQLNSSSLFETGSALFLSNMSYTTGTWAVQHRIEALNSRPLNGKTVTVSFKFAHDFGSARPIVVQLARANSLDTFSATTTVGTPVTTAAIPSTLSATTKIVCQFTLGATDATNGLLLQINDASATTVATKSLYIGEIQLEAGGVETPFEVRPYHTELALCQRYFHNVYHIVTTTSINDTVQLREEMRATPSISAGFSISTGAVFQALNRLTLQQIANHGNVAIATITVNAEL